MISKTFATVLLVTSMVALATVAHGMGGGGGGGSGTGAARGGAAAGGGGSGAGGGGLTATTGVAFGTPSQPIAPVRPTQQKGRWR